MCSYRVALQRRMAHCICRYHKNVFTRNLQLSVYHQGCHTNSASTKPSEISESVTNILKRNYSKISEKYSKEQIISLHKVLQNYGIEQSHIESEISKNPHLLSHSADKWNEVCNILYHSGFSPRKLLKTIGSHPLFLDAKSCHLHNVISHFEQQKIGKVTLMKFAIEHPILLLSEPQPVVKRVLSLSSTFPTKDLQLLIKNSPNVFTDPWPELSDKIFYVHEKMGLDQPHIANSCTLSHSILHIETRHQFLERAGLYDRPKLHRDRRSHMKNPSLTEIMDTSDSYFAQRVARLSRQEYGIFCQIMEEEFEERKVKAADSDEEVDDEDY